MNRWSTAAFELLDCGGCRGYTFAAAGHLLRNIELSGGGDDVDYHSIQAAAHGRHTKFCSSK
jgi:hypothetical protein